MGIFSGFWEALDRFLDRILNSKDEVKIGPPVYDNMMDIIDKRSRVKASDLLTEAMGGEVKKIDRNQLFKEISTIIEFYRFLYGVGGSVIVDNTFAGFNFKFVCNNSRFLKPLYTELGRIFGKMDIAFQYSDNLFVDIEYCVLNVIEYRK